MIGVSVDGLRSGHPSFPAYLSTTELQVGRVHLPTQNLVQSGCSSQDDGLALDLNGSVSQPQEVGTNTDGTSRDQRDGKDVVVCSRSSTGDETGSLQTLDSETVFQSDDGGDLVTPLSIHLDLVRNDAAGCKTVQDLFRFSWAMISFSNRHDSPPLSLSLAMFSGVR